jgi:hypothetical protein
MIIPLHLLPESGPELSYSLAGLEIDPSLVPRNTVELESPIASAVELSALQRFAQMMEGQGRRVSATRMVYDRLYACERLAEAYGSENTALRELAVTLYEGFERAGEWGALIA